MRAKEYLGRFDLLPEFWRRLRKHWADAVMGGSLIGIPLFVAALFTTVPHWLSLLVLIGAFFVAAYMVWREDRQPESGVARALMREQLLELRSKREARERAELKEEIRRVTGYEDDDV
jgi:hypothetical protein